MTLDPNHEDRLVEHEPGLAPAEQGENREAPAPGGSSQGASDIGARGTADGGQHGTDELEIAANDNDHA